MEVKVFETLEGWIAVLSSDEDEVVAGPYRNRRELGGELIKLNATSIND